MFIYLKSWSILQNIDILNLYKVDWLSRIHICQNTLVCSDINFRSSRQAFDASRSEAQRGFLLLSISNQPHPSGKGTICTDCRLVYQILLWQIDLKGVVARTPTMPTNNFTGTARMWNINGIIKVRCIMSLGEGLDFHIRYFFRWIN